MEIWIIAYLLLQISVFIVIVKIMSDFKSDLIWFSECFITQKTEICKLHTTLQDYRNELDKYYEKEREVNK